MKFTYVIECDNGKDGKDGSGPFIARIVNKEEPTEETPFVAEGDTPILAMAALGEVFADWANGGADRWCNTSDGQERLERIAAAIAWSEGLH